MIINITKMLSIRSTMSINSSKRPSLSHKIYDKNQTLVLRRKLISTRIRAYDISSNVLTTKHPIKNMNLKKNVALGTMFFSNLMVYTITRDLKDVMFITDCGVESIPFVKTWINLPVSLFFMWLYKTVLQSFHSNYYMVYCITFGSVSFLQLLFGMLLYPIRSNINILHTGNTILDNWISTSFYTLSPIWGTIIVSLLFWSIANKYTTVDDAKKIYPLFGFIANIALVSASFVMHISGTIFSHNWEMNVRFLMLLCAFFNVLNIGSLTYIHNNFEANDVVSKKSNINDTKESIFKLLTNPFVRNMIIMISTYGMIVGFYETTWKYYVKSYYTDPILYSKFMATLSGIKGVITMSMMLVSARILQKLSWRTTAMVTPTVIFTLGSLFYYFIFTNQSLIFVVMIGGIINVFTKASKYAFFDPCKEIAYIPMDEKIKTQGKATVDIIGSPLGKSGSQLIHQYLIFSLGIIPNTTPYTCIIFIACCFAWIVVVNDMNKFIDS